MIARVIVQTNQNTGEQHVTFCDDEKAPLEDMLVTAPGWEHSTVLDKRVLILSMDEGNEHIEALMNNELHTAMTEHKLTPIDKAVRNLLEGRDANVQ